MLLLIMEKGNTNHHLQEQGYQLLNICTWDLNSVGPGGCFSKHCYWGLFFPNI